MQKYNGYPTRVPNGLITDFEFREHFSSVKFKVLQRPNTFDGLGIVLSVYRLIKKQTENHKDCVGKNYEFFILVA